MLKGYAVLRPDIVPKADEFGASAVRAVLAGVKAAVATGIVDEARLGLTGQSYGGLETAFIITHPDIFKAADAVDLDSARSEARTLGNECVSTCISRCSPHHK